MKRRFQMLLENEQYEQVMAISGDRGISEFIRDAIKDKIDSINQKRKDISNSLSSNQVDTKKLEQMMSEAIMQNKVLFEQLHSYQELFKLILRRATIGSVTSGMNLEKTDHQKSLDARKIIDNMLADDFTKLKI